MARVTAADQRREQREEPQPDATDPGERGEADGRHDDDERDDAAEHRDRPAPEPGETEHGGDDADLLREPEEPLVQELDAEDLVDRRERPDAPGPVEVQEVLVREVTVQDPLREDEHEALFHRRTLRPQQTAQREQEQEPEPDEDERGLLAGAEVLQPVHDAGAGWADGPDTAPASAPALSPITDRLAVVRSGPEVPAPEEQREPVQDGDEDEQRPVAGDEGRVLEDAADHRAEEVRPEGGAGRRDLLEPLGEDQVRDEDREERERRRRQEAGDLGQREQVVGRDEPGRRRDRAATARRDEPDA